MLIYSGTNNMFVLFFASVSMYLHMDEYIDEARTASFVETSLGWNGTLKIATKNIIFFPSQRYQDSRHLLQNSRFQRTSKPSLIAPKNLLIWLLEFRHPLIVAVFSLCGVSILCVFWNGNILSEKAQFYQISRESSVHFKGINSLKKIFLR